MWTWAWVISAVLAVSCASIHNEVPKNIVCRGGGYIYDAHDCQVFYKCVYANKLGSYVPVKTVCSPGTVFSKEHHNTCVPPKKSTRLECEHLRPGTLYSLRVKDDSAPQHLENAQTTGAKREPIVCKKQGFLEDPDDCTKFYVCVVSGAKSFKKYDYFCPPSTVWETKRRWCVVSWATSREECKTNDAPADTDDAEAEDPMSMPFLPPPDFGNEDGEAVNPDVPGEGPGGPEVPESGKKGDDKSPDAAGSEKEGDDQSPVASDHVPVKNPAVVPSPGSESGVEHPAVVPEGDSVNQGPKDDTAFPNHGKAPIHQEPEVPSRGDVPEMEYPDEPDDETESGESNDKTEVPEHDNDSGEHHGNEDPTRKDESEDHHPGAPLHGDESGDRISHEDPAHKGESDNHHPVAPEHGNESNEQNAHEDSAHTNESDNHHPVASEHGNESNDQNAHEDSAHTNESDNHHPVAPEHGNESGNQNSHEDPAHTNESNNHHPVAPEHGNESSDQNAHKDESGDDHPEAPGRGNDSDDQNAHKDESRDHHPEAPGHGNESDEEHSKNPDHTKESGDADSEVPDRDHALDDKHHPKVSVGDDESGDVESDVPGGKEGSHVTVDSERGNESGDEDTQIYEHENGSDDEEDPASPVNTDESKDEEPEFVEPPKADEGESEGSPHYPVAGGYEGGSIEPKPAVVPEDTDEPVDEFPEIPPAHGSGDDSKIFGHGCASKPSNTCPNGPTNTVSTHCPIGHLSGNQVALVCPTGFRRHPRYCNLFYQCTAPSEYDYKVVVLSCPGNTCFDNSKMQCLPPNEIADPCGGLYADASLLQVLARHALSPVEAPRHRLCPGVGNYPYQDGCSDLFYKCVENPDNSIDGYVYKCPPGYLYWAASQRCEKANRFDCSGTQH